VRRLVKDVLIPVAVAVALAFVIQAAVAKPYEIPTESMVPTIQPHDRVIANRLVYRFRSIARGDIIVFDPPPAATATCGEGEGGNIPFVKRVIGLPGDLVSVKRGVTYVNGKPFVIKQALRPNYSITFQRVPPGRLIVMGDNRPGSCDSHLWKGPENEPEPFVPESSVIGQAEITYWPLSHLKFLD
jgi:signal peptidase I